MQCSDDQLLWHYATATGMLGILESKKLWAFDCEFMNDAHEMMHGKRVAERVLDAMVQAKEGQATERFLEWQSLMHDFFRSSWAGPHLFVVSLSAAPDLLSQWRAYGGGGGYAIGFKKAALQSLATSERTSIVECVYSEPQQIEMMRDMLQDLEARFANDDIWRWRKGRQRQLQTLAQCSRLKHPGFAEEKEWRLIREWNGVTNNLRYRTRRIGSSDYLVPYTELDLPEISEVIVGPMAHQPMAVPRLNLLLHMHGQGQAQVRTSQIPYRL